MELARTRRVDGAGDDRHLHPAVAALSTGVGGQADRRSRSRHRTDAWCSAWASAASIRRSSAPCRSRSKSGAGARTRSSRCCAASGPPRRSRTTAPTTRWRTCAIHPAPVQAGGPPIVVAGRKEPAMRRAAVLGDGWFPYLYSPRRYRRRWRRSRRSRRGVRAATSRGSGGTSGSSSTSTTTATRLARRRPVRWAARTARTSARWSTTSPPPGPPPRSPRRCRSSTTPAARHFVFCPATDGADAQPVLDRLVGDVVPSLHRHAARAAQ